MPRCLELRGARGDRGAPRRDAGFDRRRAAGSSRSRCSPRIRSRSLRTVTLGPHLARLPEELRDPFAEAVLERDGRSARPRLRPPQHRGARRATRARMRPPRIVLLPGDGIGPEIVAAARRLLEALGEFEFDEQLIGGCLDRRRTAPPSPTRCSRPAAAADAVLLGAVGGPKWDTTDPDAPRPEQGLLGLRKGLGPVREPAPGPAEPGAGRREPAARGADRRHRPAGRPRADRRHLLRRQRPRRRPRPRRPAPTRSGRSSGSPASASRRRRRAGSDGRTPGSPRSTRRTSSRPRGSGARPSTRVAAEYPDVELDHLLVDNAAMQLVSRPGRVRRDRHREPLRRHPQRRGGDAHRLARDAALGQPRRRGRPRACSSRSTARRPTSPGRDRQPARDLPLGGDDAPPRARPGGRGRADRGGGRRRARARACAPPTCAAAGESTREVGTERDDRRGARELDGAAVRSHRAY